jgi:hypothetical protein
MATFAARRATRTTRCTAGWIVLVGLLAGAPSLARDQGKDTRPDEGEVAAAEDEKNAELPKRELPPDMAQSKEAQVKIRGVRVPSG